VRGRIEMVRLDAGKENRLGAAKGRRRTGRMRDRG
jgi:hypothetical protein